MLPCAKLVPSDSAINDNFGRSVAISDNYALVGADRGKINNINTGKAYLFDLDSLSESMAETAKLTPSDGVPSGYFGHSVALSENYALVGATGDKGPDGTLSFAGAAYLFDLSNVTTAMTETDKLANTPASSQDYFGYSVAMSNSFAIVGADGKNTFTGAAYVYMPETPAFARPALSETGATSATVQITIDSGGTSAVTEQGICYGTTPETEICQAVDSDEHSFQRHPHQSCFRDSLLLPGDMPSIRAAQATAPRGPSTPASPRAMLQDPRLPSPFPPACFSSCFSSAWGCCVCAAVLSPFSLHSEKPPGLLQTRDFLLKNNDNENLS